jgi:hypothetical protein
VGYGKIKRAMFIIDIIEQLRKMGVDIIDIYGIIISIYRFTIVK